MKTMALVEGRAREWLREPDVPYEFDFKAMAWRLREVAQSVSDRGDAELFLEYAEEYERRAGIAIA
jgi:hypothetical protein